MKNSRGSRNTMLLIVLAALALVAVLGWQRKNAASQSVFDTLGDAPRGQAITENTFYSDQLTKKEYDDYIFLREKMEKLEGGILTLPEPLTGKEYQRIITALEYEGDNCFYGFADIPLTEENRYVFQEEKNPARIVDEEISKVVLFLSCAEGISLSGQISQDGTLINLEEIQAGLSVNREEKVEEIRAVQEETEKIMEEILAGIPAEAGDKTTAEYLLKWLDDNMEPSDSEAASRGELAHMGDMLDKVYPYNHLSALTRKKGSVLGYAKIYAELLRRAGIPAHVVMGSWNSQWTDGGSYVLCEMVIDGQRVYADASGAKSSSLAGNRYLSEKEAVSRMTFVDYFDYK